MVTEDLHDAASAGNEARCAVDRRLDPARSNNWAIRQLRISSTVGIGKEALFRSTAMDRNLVSPRRPNILFAYPLGVNMGTRHLHTPRAAVRHSARRDF